MCVMCVCVHVFVHVCTHVCMCVHVCACACASACACVCACVGACVCACVHACVYVHVYMHVYMHVCVHVCVQPKCNGPCIDAESINLYMYKWGTGGVSTSCVVTTQLYMSRWKWSDLVFMWVTHSCSWSK